MLFILSITDYLILEPPPVVPGEKANQYPVCGSHLVLSDNASSPFRKQPSYLEEQCLSGLHRLLCGQKEEGLGLIHLCHWQGGSASLWGGMSSSLDILRQGTSPTSGLLP